MRQQELFRNYPDVVDAKQLSEMLGNISMKSVYRLLHDHSIDHIKIGKIYKIPKVHVIKYLNITQ